MSVRHAVKKNVEMMALDPEAIAYDRCVRAIKMMQHRMKWNSDTYPAVGRIVSSLTNRFGAQLPKAVLARETREAE